MTPLRQSSASPIGRIAFVDVARGLGILLVVIGHNPLVLESPARFNFVFSFHLPLFFFLSGLFLMPATPWGRQLTRRADGLLKPYFVTLGILAVAQWALRGRAPEALLAGILYGTGATLTWVPLWYLPHLWLATLAAIPIGRALMTQRKPRWLAPVMLLSLLTLGVYALRASHTLLGDLGLPWSADVLGISLFFLLSGWLMRDTLLANPLSPLTGVLCLAALLVLQDWQSASMDLNLRRYDHLLWSTLAALLGIATSLSLAHLLAHQKQVARLLGYIGNGTLFILIFHAPIQSRVIAALDARLEGPTAMHAWLGFIVAVALPLLAWHITRRNRYLRALMLAGSHPSPQRS